MTRRAHLLYSFACLVLGVCAIVGRSAGTPLRLNPQTPLRADAAFRLPAGSGALLIPVVGVARSELRDSFGAPRSGHRHAAIDIMAPRGTPAIAAVSGTIMKLDHGGAGGLTIYLADERGEIVYYYAHLDRYAADLRESDHVAAGQVLGYVGTTGNAPPNRPHLHFGIGHLPPTREWWKGDPIDPYPILMASGETVR